MKHPFDPNDIPSVLSGQGGPEERAALDAWRKAAPANEQTFREVADVWQRVVPEEPSEPFDVAAGWERLQARLQLPSGDSAPVVSLPARRRKRPTPAIFALAAAIVLAVTTVWLMRQPPDLVWQERVAGSGDRSQITLPDGTAVWLNAGTQIQFPEQFAANERRVILDGHAYFEVTEQDVPFVVQTGHGLVRVLGTRFDVWSRNGKTRVMVRDGRVSLAGKGGAEVVLGPNQLSECGSDGRPHAPRTVDAESALAWLTGKIVFPSLALDDVVADLERHFGAEIDLAGDSLDDRKVTASFEDEDLATILDEIGLTLNLEISRDGESYRIAPKD